MNDLFIFTVGCFVTIICLGAVVFLLWGAYLDSKPSGEFTDPLPNSGSNSDKTL